VRAIHRLVRGPCDVKPSAGSAKSRKTSLMKMALMIIEGALEQCATDGYRVSVVVVD
jgi:hypothetical protein